MTDNEITIIDTTAKTERIPNTDPIDQIELGEWYWHTENGKEMLWCVTHVGSNFAKIESPDVNGNWSDRIHFDNWDEQCRFEPDPQKWFDQWSEQEKREIRRLNAEIKDICSRLGVNPDNKRIGDSTSSSNLALVSSASNAEDYKASLVKAEKTELPALFKEIKEHSAELTRWLKASSLSTLARCGDMQETIEVVKDRIFMVSVYAGLVENVEQVRDGEPAAHGEKLRLMQGKLFMDEECLLNYSHGGMEFKNIGQFDEWLAKPENCDRILPFPRCMVAFQVRRFNKDRPSDGTLRTAWINFQLEQADKLTFLYIRNGERLYRLNTELEFGDELFAGREEFGFEEMMVENSSSHPTMTVREYESHVEEHKEKRNKYKQELKTYNEMHAKFVKWQEENPDADEMESDIDHKYRSICPPHWFESFNPKGWSLLNESNVYLDDINDRIRKQANEYNRISTMIQGLLDRSEILHPHPPVKLWTAQGFEQFIELIYDHDCTLYDGPEPPSWEEYKAKCGESIGVGSIVIGQYEEWHASLPRETGRYNRDSTYKYVPSRYTEGNPGPGHTVQEFSNRTKKATFRWQQTRYIYRASRWEQSGNRTYDRSFSVHRDKLFNISAYKPGDYKQFFNDPRTRRQYLKWAHMLLTAEEFHAGNLDPATLEKRKGDVE